jgi:acyl carrier protein
MPLTCNGKVDRENLPPPDAARSSDHDNRPGPAASSPLEQTLTDIWCDVLGLEGVERDEHFVEVGGDSLLSVEIALRATAAGVPLDPQDLFRLPTIAELAAFAQSTR